MFEIWKMFPKMFFSFGDQDGDGDGQGSGNGDGDAGNDDGGAKGGDGQATDEFIDIGEVKVPKEALEKYAKETYKDRFEAFDNKEKWQAKLTQEAMQNSQFRRKAADYDRLLASKSVSGGDVDMKTQYVNQMRTQFPDIDPRFLEMNAQFIDKISGAASQKSLSPFLNKWSAQQERAFMDKHKDVVAGSPEAMQIADLIDASYDPEDAYEKVMGWANPGTRKILLEKEVQEAIKRQDEENRLKLKRQRTGGTGSGKKKDPETFDEAFEEVYAESQQDR